MLSFTAQEDRQNKGFCFIGASSAPSKGGLISSNSSSISSNVSLVSSNFGSGLDTCSFYDGPSDSAILAFGESYESCGVVAYAGESCGTVAYSGSGESCGSVASSCSSDSSFGGGCSYSC